MVPLDDPDISWEETHVPPPIRDWLIRLAETAQALRRAHPKTNTLERMLESAEAFLQQSAEEGIVAAAAVNDENLNRAVPVITKSWSAEEHAEAKHVIRTAQALAKIQAGPLSPLLRLLHPFALDCRRRFVQSGYLSFDGLLARARTLLQDHPRVRRELKGQFRSLLVDEFQDTDPVQYEMILYLAEAEGDSVTEAVAILTRRES